MTVIFGLLLALLEGEAGVKLTRRSKKGCKISVILFFKGKERKKQTIPLVIINKIIKKRIHLVKDKYESQIASYRMCNHLCV